MSNSIWLYTIVSLCSFVFRWADAQTPYVDILTSECRRIIGSEIVIRGTFDTLPSDPVEWRSPNGLPVASCEPDSICDIPTPGYSISQDNAGLNYTIVIQSANNMDSGDWMFKDLDNNISFVLPLLSVNLTTVDVSCDWPHNETIVIKSGSTQNIKCFTECIHGNSILTFSLKNIETDVSFQNTSSSVSCASGGGNRTSTISLDNSQVQQSGDYKLCSVLSDVECVEQFECKSLVFEPTTTTTPPTPTTTEPTTPCLPRAGLPRADPDCDLIAVVVLAGLLIVGCITFLGILIKKGVTGSREKGVIAILVTTALVAMGAVILVGFDLNAICVEILSKSRNSKSSNCAEESESASGISELGISGSVLFALAGVAFIVALVIYCKHRQPAKAENGVDMTSGNGASRKPEKKHETKENMGAG